ncbi:hypothetical protein [Kitasatospora sp. NBC_01302]|nr:hypothetical protein OG294_40675 [Kitasatospora sp. NBC_01302]
MSEDEFGDDADDLDDPLTLSPAVQDLLGDPTVPPSIYVSRILRAD